MMGDKVKNPRWQLALMWARYNGIKGLKPDSNYTTVRKRIIKAGLIDEWNAHFTEWRIKEAK